ncbi:hypothetical protein GALL_422320 [mine drainage metagenome]|uniref:Uncharacterized protein n=1 Tax=mine drainage metagenome TaxID=410659 RepID=A0A1J5PX80_9ZZZZ
MGNLEQQHKRRQERLLPAALRVAILGIGMSMGLCAAAAQAAEPAAAPSQPVNLQNASNTDLPGSPSRVRIDQSLGVHAIKVRDGAVVLNTAVLLKVYVYAYSKQPVNYTGILTADTEMIDPPAPVQATAREKQQIDAMIAFAKAHPTLLIRVDDIALDPYVPADKSYPIDNRLFIHGAGYYFDNSPYHYSYDHPEAFRHLQCTDPAMLKTIDQAIASYIHFHMGIACTVLGADARTQGLLLRVDEARIKDALGNVLIDQKAG